MYVFWFNSQKGNDDTIYCAKVVKKLRTFNDTKRTLIQVEVDPDSPLTLKKGQSVISVPETEGAVYKRRFWLKEEDPIRAMEIVNDYLKQKWLDTQKRMMKLETRYTIESTTGIEIL